MKLVLKRAVNFEILMTRFLLFLEKLFQIKVALYLKDPVPYLAVFIFDIWNCSSFLVLYGSTDTFFWKKLPIVLKKF